MNKLVVCIMGQNCEKFIGMALESVKDADAIVYCDGGSSDDTKLIVEETRKSDREEYECICDEKDGSEYRYCPIIIENKYNQEDKGMNGKQRNFYLKYLQENYKSIMDHDLGGSFESSGWWALCIDADEVVEDLSKIKEFIQEASEDYLYNIPMRHFVGDLGHEDANQGPVLARLFKIKAGLKYPEVEHPVLQNANNQYANTNLPPIWHLAYVPNVWDYKKKYENHLKKSNMHTPQFLKNWYYQHLFGQYPKKPIDLRQIPEIILKEFGIDKDEFYFAGRIPNLNNFIMLNQWKNYFKECNSVSENFPLNIYDVGCGFGNYGFIAKELGLNWKGVELSDYAVKSNPYNLNIAQGDICSYNFDNNWADMFLVVDILEHLEEKDLDKALKNICKAKSSMYLFSIPFLGDPNLNADPTHKIKKDKQWWLDKLNKYFKIKDAPKDWMLKEQLLIGEIK